MQLQLPENGVNYPPLSTKELCLSLVPGILSLVGAIAAGVVANAFSRRLFEETRVPRSKFVATAVVVSALIVYLLALAALSRSADLTVRVSDPSGVAILNAEVTFAYPKGSITRFTDSQGVVTVSLPDAGRIVVSASGFDVHEADFEKVDAVKEISLPRIESTTRRILIRLREEDGTSVSGAAIVLAYGEGIRHEDISDSLGFSTFSVDFSEKYIEADLAIFKENISYDRSLQLQIDNGLITVVVFKDSLVIDSPGAAGPVVGRPTSTSGPKTSRPTSTSGLTTSRPTSTSGLTTSGPTSSAAPNDNEALVPFVIGDDRATAETKMTNAGFTTLQFVDAIESNRARGTVESTSPGFRTLASLDTLISISIATGEHHPTMPDIGNMRESVAIALLRSDPYNLFVDLDQYRTEEAGLDGVVWAQGPAAGTSLEGVTEARILSWKFLGNTTTTTPIGAPTLPTTSTELESQTTAATLNSSTSSSVP